MGPNNAGERYAGLTTRREFRALRDSALNSLHRCQSMCCGFLDTGSGCPSAVVLLLPYPHKTRRIPYFRRGPLTASNRCNWGVLPTSSDSTG